MHRFERLAAASLIAWLWGLSACSTSSVAAGGGPWSGEALADRLVHRRAFAAVVWGMPAVNTELMREQMLTKTKGEVNQVLYWSKPADASNQTLTPNPDTIYFMCFYDVKDAGPLVLDVPPADTGSFAGNVVDVWQMPIDDVGPAGADKGAGGKYLIVPPGWQQPLPEGFLVLRSNTYTGYALLRSNLASHAEADVAKAIAYGKRLGVYPLSQAANPPATRFADAEGILFDSTIRYDASFFRALHGIVQNEPWLERDRAMIDQLASIGIRKGSPFAPDAKTQAILTDAIHEAHAWMDMRYDTDFLDPYWPGSRWLLPAPPSMRDAYASSYGDPDSYPVDARSIAYTYAYIGIKRLGAAQFYLMATRDQAGQRLDGGKAWHLRVPPNAPAKQYWSATVYDREKHTVLATDRASRASNATELQKNADGSVDVWFAPKAPPGKETNWVPTIRGRDFEVLFRLYGPDQPLFDKTWKLPDIEEVRQ